jgi:hypothetical protein
MIFSDQFHTNDFCHSSQVLFGHFGHKAMIGSIGHQPEVRIPCGQIVEHVGTVSTTADPDATIIPLTLTDKRFNKCVQALLAEVAPLLMRTAIVADALLIKLNQWIAFG